MNLNCDVCKIRFNKEERRPIISDCGDTICEKCRIEIILCPLCKQPMDKNKWTINKFLMKQIQKKPFQADTLFRVCFIGMSGAGKSSLLLRLCRQSFSESIPPTIGLDFKIVEKEVNGANLRFQLWDTVGQERFQCTLTSTYRDADIVIIVFDIQEWSPILVNKYQTLIEEKCKKNVKKIYVENKIDLVAEFNRKQMYHYISCKNNEGIDQLWNQIIKITLQNPIEPIKLNQQRLENGTNPQLNRNRGQRLRTEPIPKQKKKCC